MQKVDNRFGFFAPKAPPARTMPKIESELLLGDIIKVDAEQTDQPADPVGAFVKAAEFQQQTKGTTIATGDFDVRKAILAAADVRGPLALTKDTSGAALDWSWSTPISTDAPLSKRASPAREHFRRQLEEFFPNHEEEISEICEAAAEVSALLAEEAA